MRLPRSNMKLPRHNLPRNTVSELSSLRQNQITPGEAANVELAKWGAVTDGFNAASDVAKVISDTNRQLDNASDKVDSAIQDAYMENALTNNKEEQKERSMNDPSWTKDIAVKNTQAILDARRDAIQNIRNPKTRAMQQKIHDATAPLTLSNAAIDAAEFEATKIESDWTLLYKDSITNKEWNRSRNLIQLAMDNTGGNTPIIDPIKGQELLTALDKTVRKDVLDTDVENFYQTYLKSPEEGQLIYDSFAEDKSLTPDERSYVLAQAQSKMRDANVAHSAKEDEINLNLDIEEEKVSQGILTGDEPKTPDEVNNMYWGEGQKGLSRRKTVWRLAMAMQQSKEDLVEMPTGPWRDSDKNRKLADSKLQSNLKLAQEQVESQSGEWSPDVAAAYELAYTRQIVNEHHVVPQGITDRFASIQDKQGFIDNVEMAMMVLDQGQNIDLNAETKMNQHYENVYAMFKTGERGIASASSLANQYWDNVVTVEEGVKEQLETEWYGRTGPSGIQYDSQLVKINDQLSDSHIRSLVGEVKGIDALAQTEGDTDEVPVSYLETLRGMGIAAARRAQREGLPESVQLTAANNVIKKRGTTAYGLNVTEDGTTIQQAMLDLPTLSYTKSTTDRGVDIEEKSHAPLRNQLLNEELPAALNAYGENTQLQYVIGTETYYSDLDEIDPNSIYFETYSQRGQPLEYRVFIRDTESESLAPVNIVNADNKNIPGSQVFLNTEIDEVKAKAEAEAKLEEEWKKSQKLSVGEKINIDPYGIEIEAPLDQKKLNKSAEMIKEKEDKLHKAAVRFN